VSDVLSLFGFGNFYLEVWRFCDSEVRNTNVWWVTVVIYFSYIHFGLERVFYVLKIVLKIDVLVVYL